MRIATILLIMALPACSLASGVAESPGDFVQSMRDVPVNTQLSTNWLAAARAAIPAEDWPEGPFNFRQITNRLCEQSEAGNKAAEALWGMVLISHKDAPEESHEGLRLLEDSAAKGYDPAMLQLGLLYDGGIYVPTNYDEGFHWFSLAAAAGNAEAELQLGACYHYGFGTAPDLTKTVKLYRQAAMQTNYVAMKSLGYLLMNGLGTAKDVDTAKYWFKRAAEEGGNRRAMYNLGAIYAAKYPDTNAMAEAFRWYQQSARLGDAMGCFELAECFRHGWGTETNLLGYHEWIFHAASLGATEAEFEVGLAYQIGDGVPINMEDSVMWYRKAAEKNHPAALYNLALYNLKNVEHGSFNLANEYMFRAAEGGHREAQFQYAMSNFRGDIGPSDFEKGKQRLAEAANNGWNRAEFVLFQLYYNGVAPGPNLPKYPQDKTEAIKWLRRAAEHGNFQAQSILAVMLIRSTDIERNTAEAEKWLRNAATHGYAEAQNDLGFAILNGDIGSSDVLEAATWCELAKSKWPNPKTLRTVVEPNLSNALSRLTPYQQTEVANRVKEFQPIPVPESNPLVKDWDKFPQYQQENGQYGH